MGRPIRYIPKGGSLVEVTLRTTQGRYLLRPDPRGRVNEIVLGVLGRAQRLYSMSVVAVAVMSSHLHLLLIAKDAGQLALFMGHVGGNLSKEIGRLHGWPGQLWARRYRSILVSEEEEVQVARLRYVLAAGVKEDLVERAIEWPGVHCARALTRGQALRGCWFDRTGAHAARQRGERSGRNEHSTEETLVLDPLPCWGSVSEEEQRRRARELLRDIEREARIRRHLEGVKPVGAERVMRIDPHYRPATLASSPAPSVHALRHEVRQAMRETYASVLGSYLEASRRLRAGEQGVSFPEGTFPPRRPFVPFARGRSP